MPEMSEMPEMPEKLYFSWEDFETSIDAFEASLRDIENPHLVALYRGSLPLGVTLSNRLNLPLSIIDFQTRDKSETKQPRLIKNDEISTTDTLVIIDDIADTLLTLRVAKNLLNKEFPYNKVKGLTIHWNNHASKIPDWISYQYKSNGQWVHYPWE